MKSSISGTTLGVVAICRNEERDLPGFLEHLLPWVDEIVIVDDGSVDGTRGIAKGAGKKVTVIEHEMDRGGGFAQQRNIGIAASRADWILNMDVDERVTPQLAQEILSTISHTPMNGFRYQRTNFFAHRPMKAGGWASWNNPQLARRGYHRYINRFHERCVVDGEPDTVGQLSGKMWHLNDHGYSERLAKSFQYTALESEHLLESARRVSFQDLLFRPPLEFIKKYLIKFGFIDGVPGLIAAIHAADAVFRAYALAWDQQNRIPREQLEDQIRSMWASQTLETVRQPTEVRQRAE